MICFNPSLLVIGCFATDTTLTLFGKVFKSSTICQNFFFLTNGKRSMFHDLACLTLKICQINALIIDDNKDKIINILSCRGNLCLRNQ